MRLAVLILPLVLGACVTAQIRRQGGTPVTLEEVRHACRRQAEYYGQPAAAYADCMHRHGYPDASEADY